MADVIHEFSSDESITYSELTAGHTLAATSGSETAVIRDISVEVPGERGIKCTVNNITVAKSAGSANLGGTLLLKESQTLKMFPSEEAVWVGVKTNYSSNNSDSQARYYNGNKVASSGDYFKIPEGGDTRVLMGARYQGNITTVADYYVTDLTNGGGLGTTRKINFWWADSMFGKDEGDIYYTEQFYNAKVNNGYNHLKLYDRSTNTVTEKVNGNTSYKNWSNGYTNKYLVRRDSATAMTKFQTYNTATDTLSSQINTLRVDSGSAGSFQLYDEQHNFSPLDDYAIVKTSSSDNSDCMLGLFKIAGSNVGKFVYWQTTSTFGESQTKPYRNSNTGTSSHSYCQLVKNTAGTYYVLWPYYRSNSWSSNAENYGLQIWKLGDATAMEGYFTQSTWQNPSGLSHQTTWTPENNTIDYRGFRLNDNASQQWGWGTGFCPLKKLTATDSSAQYWLYMNTEYSYLIDIDNIGGDGSTFIKQVKYKEGSTDVNTILGTHGESWNWVPDFSASTLSGSYGVMKARVTGIKST